MKKINFLIALGLISAATVQAQTTVVSLGFETGDQKYTTADAYTPGGTFGDWINKQEADVWTEPYGGDTHSGEFSFRMVNDEALSGNTWDRGFKIGNLQLEENTAYRVGFWVKSDAENRIKSSLSIGKEYFDMPISTASGQQYYYTWNNANGEWKHYSYVTYFTNKADQDALSESYTGKEDANGNIVSEVGDPFPDTYFITINLYNPGEYILDDIVLEKGVTFNEATFTDDVIKLDFGYSTNIASLAKAADGTLILDPSQVSVKINGADAPVEYLEGKSDGFLYIFLNETYAESADNVTVSFTPAADCPILYAGDKRPSADVESEMKVLGFSNETAYYDPDIDALPSAWSAAEMVSSNPENESFELDSETLKTISVTYDKVVALDFASATLSKNGQNRDLTAGMSLSEDGKTINTAVAGLEDGEYTFTLSGVTNSYGVDCISDQVITFAVGKDNDTSESKEIYSTDATFSETADGTFPVGWLANDNGTIHQYGLTDETGQVWNYNWGGNVGGGGTRAMTSYSGDLNGAAIYWRCMNGEDKLGTLTFGEQVKDYILEDGMLDPEMPEGISLYLEPTKYQITIRMCAWKNLNGNTEAVSEENAPVYTFTLEDLDGNVYARFDDVKAMPNVNGVKNIEVNNVTRSQTDFTVDKAGYYVLKFATTQSQAELLLGGVDLITMPSKAAYYKQLLKVAVEEAKAIYETAQDAAYDGTTKTEFGNAIADAENGHFTSGSEVTAVINKLKTLGEAMAKRVENIDNFEIAALDAQTAQDEMEDTKYVNSAYYKTAASTIETYASVNPSNLSDEELAEASPELVNAAALMKHVVGCTDDLTWQCYKAQQAAQAFGADVPAAYWTNTVDNPSLAASIMKNVTKKLYDAIVADTLSNVPTSTYSADGSEVTGYDFTGLIKNSRFFTLVANDKIADDTTFPHWSIEQSEENVWGGNNLHYDGTQPSDTLPVTNVQANNWKGDYNLYQKIENVPVGVYNILLNCRTSAGYNSEEYEDGTFDKYIYATVGDKTYIQKFAEGGWGTHFCMIENVEVTEGTVILGAIEKNAAEYATNTFVDDARIFFIAPADGVDYSKLTVATPGDVNEDGNVDISDIVAIINQIAGTAAYANADVNNDTNVDISDIVAVINIIAGQ